MITLKSLAQTTSLDIGEGSLEMGTVLAEDVYLACNVTGIPVSTDSETEAALVSTMHALPYVHCLPEQPDRIMYR
jgi:hypothetical protein